MTKISALTLDTAPTLTDSIPTLDAETISTKRVTLQKLRDLMGQNPKNPYMFSAYMAGAQTTVATTWTKLQMNTKRFDTNSNYNTTTYGYTVPVSGYYQFGVLALLLSQVGLPFLVGFSKDGTTEYSRGSEIPNTTGNITLPGNLFEFFNAGDIIYPMYYSGTGAKSLNNVSTQSYFYGYFVST